MEYIISGKKFQFNLPKEDILKIKQAIAVIDKLENKKQKSKNVAIAEKKQIEVLEKIAKNILNTLRELDNAICDITAVCDEMFLPNTPEEHDAVRYLLATYRAPFDGLTNEVLQTLYVNLDAFTPCENQTKLSLLKAVKKYRPFLDINVQAKKIAQNEEDECLQRSLLLLKDKEDKEFEEIFNMSKDQVVAHDSKEVSDFEYKVGMFEYELNQSIKKARSFLDGLQKD